MSLRHRVIAAAADWRSCIGPRQTRVATATATRIPVGTIAPVTVDGEDGRGDPVEPLVVGVPGGRPSVF